MHASVIAVRLSKIVLVGGLAFWAFLVTLGNVADYDANWQFVQHVLAMDTVFPDSALKGRAITDPTIQAAAYLAIIAVEGLACLAFLAAAVAMALKLRAPKAEFRRASALTSVGVALGFALWFIGFMGIGAEWFAMWQSEDWNGQQPAFRFVMVLLTVAIYVFLDTDGADTDRRKTDRRVTNGGD
jgi:predicted small integral membrane protein